jgi:hypothetical protein
MTTNTSTSNQSFTSKRSIMIRTIFSRQFMRFNLAKQFFCVKDSKISRFLKDSYFYTSHMIIKSIKQLFSMFIIRICKRTARI